ncbi:hypothetical protein P7C70_g7980, partial [Phenoliferia sp. Uapishka_3]
MSSTPSTPPTPNRPPRAPGRVQQAAKEFQEGTLSSPRRLDSQQLRALDEVEKLREAKRVDALRGQSLGYFDDPNSVSSPPPRSPLSRSRPNSLHSNTTTQTLAVPPSLSPSSSSSSSLLPPSPPRPSQQLAPPDPVIPPIESPASELANKLADMTLRENDVNRAAVAGGMGWRNEKGGLGSPVKVREKVGVEEGGERMMLDKTVMPKPKRRASRE